MSKLEMTYYHLFLWLFSAYLLMLTSLAVWAACFNLRRMRQFGRSGGLIVMTKREHISRFVIVLIALAIQVLWAISNSSVSTWGRVLAGIASLSALYHGWWLLRQSNFLQHCVENAREMIEELRYHYDGFFEGIFEVQADKLTTVHPRMPVVGESGWPPFTSPPLIQD